MSERAEWRILVGVGGDARAAFIPGGISAAPLPPRRAHDAVERSRKPRECRAFGGRFTWKRFM